MAKFDHIKPDEVYILDYAKNPNRLYLVRREEYHKPTKVDYEGFCAEGIRVSSALNHEWGSVTVSSSKPAADRQIPNLFQFRQLTPEKIALFKKENEEMYKYFQDFYNKPAAPSLLQDSKSVFSDNPEDYWFFTRGLGWELVERAKWRMAERDTEVVAVSWENGKERTVTPNMGFINHSFKDLWATNDHKIITLRQQNPKECEKFEDYYREPAFKLLSETDMSKWLVFKNSKFCYTYFRHKDIHKGCWMNHDKGLQFQSKFPGIEFAEWPQVEEHTRNIIRKYQPEVAKKFEAYYAPKPDLDKVADLAIQYDMSVVKFAELQNISNTKAQDLLNAARTRKAVENLRSHKVQLGSDFDIDKRRDFIHPNKQYELTGLLNIYKQPIKEGDFLSLKDPYKIGYDPYQKQSDLATAMGMAIFAQQQQINSPLTNNNEPFKLPTAPKCITGRKELTGSAVQSTPSKVTIAAEHPLNRGGLSASRVKPRIS